MPPAVAFHPALFTQCALALGLLVVAALFPPQFLITLTLEQQALLYTCLDFLSIAVALMIFTVGWFSFGQQREARFQIIACAFLAVGVLNFAHTLLHFGEPTRAALNSLETADYFQLLAQLSVGWGLLVANLLSPHLALSARQRSTLLAATVAVTGGVLAIGIAHLEPPPLTSASAAPLYKTLFEYLIIALYLAVLLLLIRAWRRERDSFRAL